jgi:holo-[acyl-carrier protein] synthase
VRKLELKGIGIDLVALSRIKDFLKNHPRACERILTHSEIEQWRKKRNSAVQFSQFFAAKEAFFKATGGTWMGLDGFRSVEIECLPHEQFRVSALKLRRGLCAQSYGQYFRTEKWIGAYVILVERNSKSGV